MPVIAEPEKEVRLSDYSLVGEDGKRAVEQGLAEADWYQSPVPREAMVELLARKNGPAIRDTLIWLGLLGLFGTLGFLLWGSWWAILPFAAYGVMYGTTSDSRWHESSHGTAFKTDWMNNALYEVASFMVMRESTLWRWSHTRHHSDTIIVGRDPEIVVPRPPDIKSIVFGLTGLPQFYGYFKRILFHSTGRLDAEERTFIPESDHGKIYGKARIYLAIYAVVVGSCFYFGSILPLMFIGLPNLYGIWLMPVYGLTQHAGLAENVLDHRMNCRTVYMNRLNRFLYWNMNYHVEHHMFPLVPYHNLPRLHELVKDDMPVPYASLWDAWSEIIPALIRQTRDPGYYVRRKLPTPSVPAAANVAAKTVVSTGLADETGWVEVGATDLLASEDVLRFDYAEHTYAVYRTADGKVHATDGMCTHGNTHLATGLVKGCLIECPKHNGRFDVRDGSPQRPPVCLALRTYPAREEAGRIAINVAAAEVQHQPPSHAFKVVRNQHVATFIRELELEPAEGADRLEYLPGQYVQLHIPAYSGISFSGLEVPAPYHQVWKAQHVFDYQAQNRAEVRRNYSLVTNPARDKMLRFNVRIATPPAGQDCPAGVGSTYVWNLKPGDTVTAVGPLGDFLIKDTQREMVYLGGGSGMAPLRSHLAYLFETLQTTRRVSFWYGARTRQELYYQEYFEDLARRFDNFSFHPVLSEPLDEDAWEGPTGLVHEVLQKNFLDSHPDQGTVEYYLCGPQPMIQAARKMLDERGVASDQVAFDEF